MPYIWRCQISYNGSGTFLINSAGQPVVPGTTITTTAFNALTADLASGLTTAMTKYGQTVPTANIPMGGFKLTGLGAGTSATDAAQFGQLQNAPVATLITVAGADTITGTLVQTLTAYATGQQFSFVAAGTNTTAVTLNIDGLGAKAVTRTGAVALDAGALVSGQMAIVEYDGTRFQLINANAFTNLTVSGALTVGTTLAVTGVATLTAQPILSSLTASLPVFTDASKGLVSNTMTGTGSVMMSASPTTTGTLTAAAINASGLVAMAGAATVGTTLGVTGTSTMAAINAGGKLTTSFAGGGDFVAIFRNTTAATPYTVQIIEPAAAVSGYPMLQVTDSTGAIDRFRVNSGTGGTTVGGTLGVGTSSAKATLQVGTRVGVFQPTTDAAFGENLYFSGGNWKYIATAAASVVYLDNGSISFLTAPSGSADATASVASRMSISNAGIVTMSAYGAGTATFSAAGVISSVSDETWKVKDGIPTDPDVMLQKLAPGYWYYNNEKKETFGKDRQLGFYAQNVNAAIGPEAAPVPEEGKPWGYYDRSVLAVAVMSLQSALTNIQTLTAEFQAYKSSHP